MNYKFVWADGQLGTGSAFNKQFHHFNILQNMIAEGKLPNEFPKNYVMGSWGENSFHTGQYNLQRQQSDGVTPTDDELNFLLQQATENKSASVRYQLDLMKIHADYSDALDKWVYVRGKGGDVWDDIEFNRGKQEDFYRENWPEGQEDPPEYWDEVRAHVDAIGDLIGEDINWQTADASVYEKLEKLPIAMGMVDPTTGKFTGQFENGVTPEEVNAALFDGDGIYDGTDGYDLRDAFGKSSEDTEPEYNFSFLTDPHDELYPPAFNGTTLKPEVNKKLKGHALDALKEEYPNADDFIYFTVYGSGISYNWDEEGDFDIQMWVDIDKYEGDDISQDDLVTAIRRIIQPVNFPTFEEVVGSGDMLIQYYPKPGKGSAEENLSSQPYSCFDMETNEWLKEPEPITPEFYGDMFLSVKQKADDVALQSESLLSELERNIVSWHFWTAMSNKYDNKLYESESKDAKEKAIQNQAGVVNLFQGVFGGRAEAYAPDGKGIKDERDVVQKLLEVWGVFQRLKHMARLALPWDTQEIESKRRTHVYYDRRYPRHEWTGYPFEPMYLDPGEAIAAWVAQFGPQIYHGDWGGSGDESILSEGFKGPYEFEGRPYTFFMGHKEGGYIQHSKDYYIVDLNELDPNAIVSMGGLYSYNEVTVFQDMIPPEKIYWSESTEPVTRFESSARVSKVWNQRRAKWGDITEKAKRLMDDGQVFMEENTPTYVKGTVQGDNGTYNTEIYRQDAQSSAISQWSCSCPWGEHSWGRTRQWRKYEGRPCAHTLALYWTSLSNPAQAEEQLQLENLPDTRQQSPEQFPYGEQAPAPQTFEQIVAPTPGGPNAPTKTAPVPPKPAPQPAPEPSHLKTPDELKQLELPGTFSKWQLEKFKMITSAFNNGDKIRANKDMLGFDRDGVQHTVRRNMTGEVLWSDDDETVAIFPLNNGPLEPHLVKVTDGTNYFSVQPNAQPFVKKKAVNWPWKKNQPEQQPEQEAQEAAPTPRKQQGPYMLASEFPTGPIPKGYHRKWLYDDQGGLVIWDSNPGEMVDTEGGGMRWMHGDDDYYHAAKASTLGMPWGYASGYIEPGNVVTYYGDEGWDDFGAGAQEAITQYFGAKPVFEDLMDRRQFQKSELLDDGTFGIKADM